MGLRVVPDTHRDEYMVDVREEAEMTDLSMTYVAKKPCGCIAMVAADKPHVMADAADDLARCMKEGMAVKRIPTTEVRTMPWWCRKHGDERSITQGTLFDDCSPLSATFCPIHGECGCQEDEWGDREDDDDCPLHGMESDHCEYALA